MASLNVRALTGPGWHQECFVRMRACVRGPGLATITLSGSQWSLPATAGLGSFTSPPRWAVLGQGSSPRPLMPGPVCWNTTGRASRSSPLPGHL